MTKSKAQRLIFYTGVGILLYAPSLKATSSEPQDLNVMGSFKKIEVGQEERGEYVDLTFTEEALINFESTPLRICGTKRSLSELANHINADSKEYKMVLSGNELSGITTVGPTHVDARDSQTLRVFLSPSHLKTVKSFEKASRIKPKAWEGRAVFANYAAVAGSEDEKIPEKKRETYFIFANQGTVFKKEKTSYCVTFKEVKKIVGLSGTGIEQGYTISELASFIGKGDHPFRPNGSFIPSSSPTKPCSPVVLSFDQATLGPTPQDITFQVSFLDAENSLKGTQVIPSQFIQKGSEAIKDPLFVYLDFGNKVTGINPFKK